MVQLPLLLVNSPKLETESYSPSLTLARKDEQGRYRSASHAWTTGAEWPSPDWTDKTSARQEATIAREALRQYLVNVGNRRACPRRFGSERLAAAGCKFMLDALRSASRIVRAFELGISEPRFSTPVMFAGISPSVNRAQTDPGPADGSVVSSPRRAPGKVRAQPKPTWVGSNKARSRPGGLAGFEATSQRRTRTFVLRAYLALLLSLSS